MLPTSASSSSSSPSSFLCASSVVRWFGAAAILASLYVVYISGASSSLKNLRPRWLHLGESDPVIAFSSPIFIYLVTGRGKPPGQWIGVSKLPGVHVVYASWREPVDNSTLNVSSLDVHFYPHSTWASCRNFLLSRVDEVEGRLHARANFILFADEDLVLRTHNLTRSPDIIGTTSTSASSLHKLLMRDQPARASVEYSRSFPMSAYNRSCVQSCAFDGALDIYHRSIVDSLLPYSTKYDGVSWPLSQYIMNLLSQALLAEHCHLYREVFIDARQNVHLGAYPKNKAVWSSIPKSVLHCLLQHGFHPVRHEPRLSWQVAATRVFGRPKPGEVVPKCIAKEPGINYTLMLAEDLAKWPLTCGRS